MGCCSTANCSRNIFIQPAAGDAGGSVGAALACAHIYFNRPRQGIDTKLLFSPFLGPDFTPEEIRKMNRRIGAKFEEFEDFGVLVTLIAQKIAEGNIIGWFQGRNGVWTTSTWQSQHSC